MNIFSIACSCDEVSASGLISVRLGKRAHGNKNSDEGQVSSHEIVNLIEVMPSII
ncbi:MAG: hypothetical protein V4592_06460 [Bacteroidota bacterium]